MPGETFVGGEGPDSLGGQSAYASAFQVMLGNGGNDTLEASFEPATQANPNAAPIQLADSAATVLGGAGDDVLSIVGLYVYFQWIPPQIPGERARSIQYTFYPWGLLNGEDGADTLQGNFGRDTLLGGAGADVLDGSGDADVLDGGDGNDVMRGGSGADTLFGGAGVDVIDGGASVDGSLERDFLSYRNAASSLAFSFGPGPRTGAAAGEANDTILNIEGVEGGPFADTLIGAGGAFLLRGGPGADVLRGDGGNDQADYGEFAGVATRAGILADLGAGYGVDQAGGVDALEGLTGVRGSPGADLVFGDAGANVLEGGDGHDALLGGAGNDTLFGGRALSVNGFTMDGPSSGDDTLFGGDGDDLLYDAAFTDDVLVGGAGNDTLRGGGSTTMDYLLGGDGDDLIQSAEGSSAPLSNAILAFGGNGADTLRGGASGSTLSGDAGPDLIVGFTGGDYLIGGDGNDLIYSGFGANPGSSSPMPFDYLVGGEGNDTLIGGSETLVAFATLGEVVFVGGEGDDVLRGRLGQSSQLFFGDGGADDATGSLGRDFFLMGDGADRAAGAEGDDVLWGGAGADTLLGGAGDDLLFAQAGGGLLAGGAGRNTLFLEAGFADTVEARAGEGVHAVWGFEAGPGAGDVLRLLGTGFTSLDALRAAGAVREFNANGVFTVIDLGGGAEILLPGVPAGALTADDFAFG